MTLSRTLVLVGLMGAGKTSVGRRLAQRLGLPFADADQEIEKAANATIAEIFDRDGEAVFRGCERRVICRLLGGPVQVLATGGGAFMDAVTRERIGLTGHSLWLRADLDTLVARVARRAHRPLLQGTDARDVLARLMAERHPIYAEADLVVDSLPGSPDQTVRSVIDALKTVGYLVVSEPPVNSGQGGPDLDGSASSGSASSGADSGGHPPAGPDETGPR